MSFDGTANITLPAGITLGTEQATTSGTSIDFTGIPSGTKRIAIMFVGVSLDATTALLIQIGSGSFETTGYKSVAMKNSAVNVTRANSTIGLLASSAMESISSDFNGMVNLSLEDSSDNTWVSSGNLYENGVQGIHVSAGSKAIGGVLDRIRITTSSGTGNFDAGVVNIQYQS